MNILIIISALYLICSIIYIANLWIQNNNYSKIGLYIGILGFLVQSYHLINLFTRGDLLLGGLGKSLFLFAWFIPFVFLISLYFYRLPSLGAFIFTLAFIGTAPALIPPSGVIIPDPTLNNPWILAHVILIFLGLAFFAIAFVAGIFYIFEEKEIKEKKLGKINIKLPSLNTLDKVNHFSLLSGFSIITVGLAVGFFAANHIWGNNWHWGNKETWSILSWLLYAILLNFRLSSGWKGRKAATGAIIGFCIILFTLLIQYVIPS